MIFNQHSEIKADHAPLSPSQFSWINKDADAIRKSWAMSYAQAFGTAVHDIAKWHILKSIKISPSNKRQKDEIYLMLVGLAYKIPEEVFVYGIDFDAVYETLALYVNDAIGFHMNPEVKLVYSEQCFGTTDAIQFDKNLLRIHDLKTGTTKAHMEQLMIYAALFCLEYGFKSSAIQMELRLYQDGDYIFYNPTPDDIDPIMDQIVHGSDVLANIRQWRMP